MYTAMGFLEEAYDKNETVCKGYCSVVLARNFLKNCSNLKIFLSYLFQKWYVTETCSKVAHKVNAIQ